MPVRHFLLVYDLNAGRLIEENDLGEDGAVAAAEFSRREAQYRGRDGFEIVLVGADSIETVRKTHAHYFAGEGDPAFEALLTAS